MAPICLPAVLYTERSGYTVHTQVEAKRILYQDSAMVHMTWINRTGRYDITLTHFPLFLLSSVLLSIRVISYHPVRLIQVICTTAITLYNIRLASTCVCTVYPLRSIYNNGSIRLVSLKEQGNDSTDNKST